MMLRLVLPALARAPTAYAQALDIPRMPDGDPDFAGVWDSLWLTLSERPERVPGEAGSEPCACDAGLLHLRDQSREEPA